MVPLIHKKNQMKDHKMYLLFIWLGVRVMVFNATFNNISVISWLTVIVGGNRSTRRKPPARRKSLTNFTA